MTNTTIEAKPIKHKGMMRIAVYFKKDDQLIARIKKLEDAKWSQSLRVWHLPDNEENRARFKISLAPKLTETHEQKITAFANLMRSKRYSDSTVKTYTEALKIFLLFYADKDIAEIENDDLIRFNNEYILKNELSASYQNQIIHPVGLKNY